MMISPAICHPAAAAIAGGAAPAANPAPDELSQMCGEDSRDIAGLPIDQIQQAIQPNDAQRAALDDLANASVKAAQDIKAACPTQISLTAPDRLAAMQTRIEAMIAAVGTVQPALDKFYGLLTMSRRPGSTRSGKINATDEPPGKPAVRSCKAATPRNPVRRIGRRPRSNQDCIRPTRSARA